MKYTVGPSGIAKAAVCLRSDVAVKLLGSLLFAGLMAMCAVSFRLWFTPVPVTLQVLGVILSGLALGSRWGALSQLEYLAMGAMGMPVFANWTGGPAVFIGPSGGYLIGFVAGAFAAGWVFERLERRTSLAAWAAGVAGMAGIYLFGASWLGVWLGIVAGEPVEACIRGAWQLGIVPFVAVDFLKAAVAAGLVLGGRAVNEKWSNGVVE